MTDLEPFDAVVTQQHLASALAWVRRIASDGRYRAAAAHCVKLTPVRRSAVRFDAFDYESSASDEAFSAGCSGDPVCLSAGLLQNITRVLPRDGKVALRRQADHLWLRCGAEGDQLLTYRLPLVPADKFPALPDEPPAFGSLARDLAPGDLAALTRVSVACGRDDSLPVLTAVRLSADSDGHLIADATDRYRLARSTTGLAVKLAAPMLVPRTSLRHITAGFAKSQRVHLDDHTGADGARRLWVSDMGARTYSTRLIEGTYPEVERLLAGEFETRIMLGVGDLALAVRRTAVIAGRGQPVLLAADTDGVRLESGEGMNAHGLPSNVAASATTAQARLAGAEVDGPLRTVALNPSYLADGLALFEPDSKLAVNLQAPRSGDGAASKLPVTLTSDTSPGLTYLVMPVKISDGA